MFLITMPLRAIVLTLAMHTSNADDKYKFSNFFFINQKNNSFSFPYLDSACKMLSDAYKQT